MEKRLANSLLAHTYEWVNMMEHDMNLWMCLKHDSDITQTLAIGQGFHHVAQNVCNSPLAVDQTENVK